MNADHTAWEEIDDAKYIEGVEKAALAVVERECRAKGEKFNPKSRAVRKGVDALVTETMDEAGLLHP